MTNSNKETLIHFAKVLLFAIICGGIIITLAGILNAVTLGAIGSFYGWVAGFSFIVEIFGVISLYKKLFPKGTEKKEEKPVK